MKKSTLSAHSFDPSHPEYRLFLTAISNKVISTRIQIAKSACREQIELYWWLGSKIVESQHQHGWGKAIVERLSKDLDKLFPEVKFGFSARNLWDMRRFYLGYKDYLNLRQLVAEIPWGQHLVILNKVKDIEARRYYLTATHEMAWSRDVLTMQINSQAYERHVLSKKHHNFEKALPQEIAIQAEANLKDVYLFETLGIIKPVIETEIEARMVSKIKDVMLELGYGFTFVGNQYRLIASNGSETLIDLLFFNRHMRCLVAMELKVGKFKPEYAGRMNYQLNLLDDIVKEPWENPSIGIILCSERDRIDVEYTFRGIDKPVGVAEFKLTKKLPEELSGKLPDPKQLEVEILRELGAKN